MPDHLSFPPTSRRSFLRVSALASAAAASAPIWTEPMLAGADGKTFPSDAVMINLNENPLGPCDSARQASVKITSQGGRYLVPLTAELTKTFAESEGLKPEYLRAYPGSSDPLHYSVLAFTSPTKSYVTADPAYETGMRSAGVSGARVVRVPLMAKTYSHDVKAMLAAGPDAGMFYLCNPNNPTGTTTSHADIEYILENKPKGSIVMVDEAYIHFSDAVSAIDLVKAAQDVVVLRTFSKIYGMAGMRAGFAIARPDLLAQIEPYAGTRYIPITAAASATASLREPTLVSERKQINAGIRQELFQWLDHKGHSYIPSQTNFFMVETKRPAKQVIDALVERNVFIGRVFPALPTHVRVSVGTSAEMAAFRAAFDSVMTQS
jgi:histidinol-phosphate aminotransferase